MLEENATKLRALKAGTYRVVVIEADANVTQMDFTSFDQARACTDDAASEYSNDGTPPVAHVFDYDFRRA